MDSTGTAYWIAPALRDVLALYCEAIDRYDIDALTGLFTPDCLTDFGAGAGGELHGRDAFLDRVRTSQARFAHTHHQLGQTRVSLDATVTSVSYVTAIHQLHDGTRLDLFLQYHDTWQLDEGAWRIAERVMWSNVRSDGGGNDRWNWTPRGQILDTARVCGANSSSGES